MKIPLNISECYGLMGDATRAFALTERLVGYPEVNPPASWTYVWNQAAQARFSIGEALYKARDHENARRVYESILPLSEPVDGDNNVLYAGLLKNQWDKTKRALEIIGADDPDTEYSANPINPLTINICARARARIVELNAHPQLSGLS